MRVGINAHLISLDETYRNAGVGQFLYQLVTHLAPVPPIDGVTAYIGPAARPALLPRRPGLSYRATALPTERPPVRIAWEQTLQPALLLRDRLDLLHCPVNVAPLLSPIPTVLTIHDLSFLRYPETFAPAKRRYLTAMTGISARRARLVMTDSEHTRRDVIRLLGVPAARVRTVYPGVTEAFHPFPAGEVDKFRQRQGMPERFFLHVGTLQPRKNLERLIDAFGAFAQRSNLPHALVLVGGKGWLYEGLLARARQVDVERRIHFVGYAAPADLPLWYAAAEALVFPSLYEGFGFPLLEAMACGTPVLSSTASCLPEVAGDAAVLFDPLDVSSIADAMVRIAQEPERRQDLAARGLERAARFTWASTARHVLAAYAGAGR